MYLFKKIFEGWWWAEPDHIPDEQDVFNKFLNSLVSFGQNPQYILIYSGAKLKEHFFFFIVVS